MPIESARRRLTRKKPNARSPMRPRAARPGKPAMAATSVEAMSGTTTIRMARMKRVPRGSSTEASGPNRTPMRMPAANPRATRWWNFTAEGKYHRRPRPLDLRRPLELVIT
jgi:hypothetical protein